jgi:hypothetical protein
MPRFRPAALLVLLLSLATAVAACGSGDSGDEATASTDVNELLTQTFTGSKQVDSGKLALKLRIDAQGKGSGLDGPVSLSLNGPFQSQGDGKLPKFDLDAAVEGAGQSIQAGATSTGDKGYVSFQGTDYVLGDQVFEQFKAGFEQADKDATGGKQQSFASLGMDPRKWLTDPKNEGEAKVGDADTIKITGGVDVGKLLDDVDGALAKASSLGLAGAGDVPERLTDAQRKEILESVKDPRVEIYTGTEDQILRRMVVDVGLDDAASETSGTVAFDASITDLNEDQDIAGPENAKPFDELLGQFGGLAALGAAASGGRASSGSGSSGSSNGGSAADLEKYSDCLTKAGQDVAKARKCAELLAG